MALNWDDPITHEYQSGLDKGALYLRDVTGEYPVGVAWRGLISVTETPEGAEETKLWAHNSQYASLFSPETFGGSIEAYMSPKEFDLCDGAATPNLGLTVYQQERSVFGMAYRTRVGNDAEGEEAGYRYHLLYGCRAKPSERAMTTINESPEAATLSWDFTSIPVPVTGYRPTSILIIDSTKADPLLITWLEEELYGATPNLPLPDDVLAEADIIDALP